MKIEYAAVSERGLREYSEDAYCLVPSFGGNEQALFAGVFDGHGSVSAARVVAQSMPAVFLRRLEAGASVKRAFRDSYLEVSNSILNLAGGVCAATLFLKPPVAFFAYAGDCELRMLHMGRIKGTTLPHRAGNHGEENRIRKCGGVITSFGYVLVGEDMLQPFRSLGDAPFKKAGVIADPECGSIHISEPMSLLLGTDGLFDALGRVEIEKAFASPAVPSVVAETLKEAVRKNAALDDYTFIVLSLQP